MNDDLLNQPVLFGLKAQGHIPTIESMLKEQKSWEEIGKKINWCPETAKKHYQWYLDAQSHKNYATFFQWEYPIMNQVYNQINEQVSFNVLSEANEIIDK